MNHHISTSQLPSALAPSLPLQADPFTGPAGISSIKHSIWASSADPDHADDASTTIVAEGDSWFDFPPQLDLLDQLIRRHRCRIVKFARSGDTLENIVFGSLIDDRFKPLPHHLTQTLSAVQRLRPRVVLLSAGGNDIAGTSLASFLNHAHASQQPLRRAAWQAWLDQLAVPAIIKFVTDVRRACPHAQVIAHGYAHPVPSGRSVKWWIFDTPIGPWLKPALAKKRIPIPAGQRLIASLIDDYNNTLAALAAPGALKGFHHVDFRPIVTDSDWVDELHLSSEAYARCADVLFSKIQSIQNTPTSNPSIGS